MDETTFKIARAYRDAGISVLPVRLDGSKAPALEKPIPFWDRFATDEELANWFNGRAKPYGIAGLSGTISGHLERLDFDKMSDEIFHQWRFIVDDEVKGLTSRLCSIRTPEGYGVFYRCPGVTIPGNQKLAAAYCDGKVITLIETRGEGGYSVLPGSPAAVHATGRPYEHHDGPALTELPTITAAEREVLLRYARAFNCLDDDSVPEYQAPQNGELRVGDDFNTRGWPWEDLLVGWTPVSKVGAACRWRRPGKTFGHSATTGVCRNQHGHDLLAVFSSNASPFPGPGGGRQCSTHSKFAVYALLHCGGDFKLAARELAQHGFGQQPAVDAQSDSTRKRRNTPVHLTDRGNGLRLQQSHGKDIRHTHPWKKWLAWANKRWRLDDTGEAMRRGKAVVVEMFAACQKEIADIQKRLEAERDADESRESGTEETTEDSDGDHELGVMKSESAPRLHAMLEMAKSEPGIPILPEELDKDPWLFNCDNGTIELKTGQLREHRREDYITKLCPVEYHPEARCPTFERFVAEIMGNDAELVSFLQRLFGCCLTGDVSEQILTIFWGTGANGKSTLINTILEMMTPDYAIKANRDLLMAKKADRHPTAVAQLFGVRLAVCTETADGAKLDEAMVKEATGSDPLPARRMREDYWQFNPTHKVILVTNHKPQITGTDHGIWRRIRLVPFAVCVPDAKQDKLLPQKLKAEMAGILAWCVRGCLEWQRNGLGMPKKVKAATEAYRGEQDIVAAFIEDCCMVHRECRVKASDLYAAYCAWRKANGETEVPQRTFGMTLTERGFENKRGGGGLVWWHGIGIRPQPPGDD